MPHEAGRNSLIVGIVFLFGAIFVLMVCMLMLQTVRDIKRINVLEQENITDPLMNIYNRRYLEQRLKEELARTGRYKIPLSLLLLDIDHFKQINDRYGHPVGDKVLSNMGEILKGETRKSDLPARYGGEEIAVLLPNTGEEEAVLLAERLRASIGYAGFNETEDGGLHCTVSIGVTSLLENSCEPKELLRRADVALYYAKQTGRNRVVSYKTEYEQS